jgi:aryl-alcohol dehydrogenase
MKPPVQSFIPIRAAVLREPGGPLKIERLRMEGPRDDEVLVRLVASAPGKLPSDREVLSVIQGDAVPQKFIPKLIRLYQEGRFPFDRLVKSYDFTGIIRAIADSKRGNTVRPVLLISNPG